jgi:aarF domain-containing kinase
MKTNLSDLLAALPEEHSSDALNNAEAQERLQAIFADLAHRPVPTGSLHRLWTMSELSTQVTLAYIALWIRQFFGDAKERQRRVMETNLAVALKMVHRLGYLRGAASKLGQLLGNLPEVLPQQVVATLDTLHFQAPPMHFSLLREMVRNELGRDPSDLFAHFDKQPFAAASIGQVHRATLKSGETVAVKVQYPGIARAIAADLRNYIALIFPMRLTGQWESVKTQAEAIEQMLHQEVDYVREAENTRQARALFTPEDGVVVPLVFNEYSTARVLTTEYLQGPNVSQFLRSSSPQSVRDSFGAKIYMAKCRLCFAYANYGDPHSGNYVLMDDGRLGILDFGCVQHFTTEEQRQIRRTDRFLEGSLSFIDLLRGGGIGTDADLANEEFVHLFRRFYDWSFGPEQFEGIFDFSDENFFKTGVDLTREILMKRHTKAASMYVYLARTVFGSRALLLRLGARFNARAIHQKELTLRRSRGEES